MVVDIENIGIVKKVAREVVVVVDGEMVGTVVAIEVGFGIERADGEVGVASRYLPRRRLHCYQIPNRFQNRVHSCPSTAWARAQQS
jgi:hypothetical protein